MNESNEEEQRLKESTEAVLSFLPKDKNEGDLEEEVLENIEKDAQVLEEEGFITEEQHKRLNQEESPEEKARELLGKEKQIASRYDDVEGKSKEEAEVSPYSCDANIDLFGVSGNPREKDEDKIEDLDDLE